MLRENEAGDDMFMYGGKNSIALYYKRELRAKCLKLFIQNYSGA